MSLRVTGNQCFAEILLQSGAHFTCLGVPGTFKLRLQSTCASFMTGICAFTATLLIMLSRLKCLGSVYLLRFAVIPSTAAEASRHWRLRSAKRFFQHRGAAVKLGGACHHA
jgi:hypothetical protein